MASPPTCNAANRPGISLTSDEVIKLGINLPEPINIYPLPSFLADNTAIEENIYIVSLNFKGIKMDTTLSLIFPGKKYQFNRRTECGSGKRRAAGIDGASSNG
jgi:hypothetical protein